MDGAPRIAWVAENALEVRLGSGAIDPATVSRVQALRERVLAARLPGLTDCVPAYAALLLTFAPRALDPEGALAAVRALLALPLTDPASAPREVRLPVCYEEPHAPDLGDVAAHAGLTRAQAVALHSGALYTVAFLGFAPGFPYLLGLPPRLALARLASPRPRVAAGSVAIGGPQAGIYPAPTPGGWRLVGRTPVTLFHPERAAPALLRPGDRVRFDPVDTAAFERLLTAGAS